MFTSILNLQTILGANPELTSVFLTRQPGFITKPIAAFLGFFYNLIFNFIYSFTQSGSLGITIIFFTIIIRMLMMPLTIHQQKSTQQMQKIQPQLKKIQEKYADKKDAKSQQMMSAEINALYSKNGGHPFMSCLPLLIQLPILYASFYIFQQAYVYIDTFNAIYVNMAEIIGNNHELQVEAANIYNLHRNLFDSLDLLPLLYRMPDTEWVRFVEAATGSVKDEIVLLMTTKEAIQTFVGIDLIKSPSLNSISIILPVFAGGTTFLSTWLQSKKNKLDEDNPMASSMKMMTYMMPVMMAFVTYRMPAGVGLYWTIGNIVQIFQQFAVKKYFIRTPEEV